MTVQPILQLGHPDLYKICEPVTRDDLPAMQQVIADLHDTMMDFRAKYNAGRAIAAPQIGVFKRLVYMHIDEPVVFINPVLDQLSDTMIELWDDCMSFPELLVRVRRHKQCRITFRDLAWQKREMRLEDDLSELLQHECDHLDGVLAVSRAIDAQSFCLRSQRHLITAEHA
ncbi:MAG: peptide deformylase [Chloroflexi bacterium]|nr:MAG: peptide deformylase [Chloroflexota bacterium]